MFDVELAWNLTQFISMVMNKLKDFDKAQQGLEEIIRRDIEQRKTIEPDLGSDRFQADTISVEDSIRLKEYRPYYDYESSPKNPFLKLSENSLTVDTIFDVDLVTRGTNVKATVRSTNAKLPKDIGSPALTQRLNDYVADYLVTDKVDVDKYF